MNLQKVFCPNMACRDKHEVGKGNIVAHSQQQQRCKCRSCGHTFSYQRWAGRRGDGALPTEWVRQYDSRMRGWVGAPDYGNDVWIDGQPRVLQLFSVEREAQGAA